MNYHLLPLAQTRIEAMNQAFRARDVVDHTTSYILLGLILAVLLIATAVFYLSKHAATRIINDPKKLFAELCRAHKLSWSHRRLLYEIVRTKNLKDPAMVLLDGNLWVFDPHTEKRLCQPKNSRRLQMLQRLLFSETASS